MTEPVHQQELSRPARQVIMQRRRSRRFHRVGLVTPVWPPAAAANGIVTYVECVACSLAELGAEPVIIPGRLESMEPMEARVAPLDPPERGGLIRRGWHYVRWRLDSQRQVDRALAQRVAQVAQRLHARGELCLLEMEESFGRAKLVQDRSPVPVVVRLHGPWFINAPALGLPADAAFRRRVEAEGRAIAAADGVTCPSRNVLEQVRRQYHIELPKAAVIPNPMRSAPAAQQWRAEACEPGRILYVGRFDHLKGADLVLEAMRLLIEAKRDVRLWFVGPDDGIRDGGRVWRINEFLERYSPAVRERIDFRGRLAPADIAELRRTAAVTVIASRHENFPMTCLEAMSHGCPIVASNAGGIPEIIEHERNGLLFDSGKSDELAAQLRVMLDQPARAAELGATAAADCARRYDPLVIARRTLDYYADVLERRRRGGGGRS